LIIIPSPPISALPTSRLSIAKHRNNCMSNDSSQALFDNFRAIAYNTMQP
jgi:hypothetical protein